MKSLQQIWDELNAQGMGSDKNSCHSYISVYSEILEPYRTTAKNVLEIGILAGHSLRLWEQYFNCPVYGIDCDIKPHGFDLTEMMESGKHHIKIFDACNRAEVEHQFGSILFDIVIDDAAHSIEQQVELYNVWKHYLAPNSIYIVEDIQDLNKDRNIFENLDNSKEITILDRRNINLRYDDVMVLIRDKI